LIRAYDQRRQRSIPNRRPRMTRRRQASVGQAASVVRSKTQRTSSSALVDEESTLCVKRTVLEVKAWMSGQAEHDGYRSILLDSNTVHFADYV